MTMVQDIFKARADSFGETMIDRAVSFKLPEYQRPYDWDQANVKRFMQDCLNGLKGVASASPGHHYTFLGTVIVTSDQSKETTFDGNSLLVVDGQQRLTTLILLSCALFEAIKNHYQDIDDVSDYKTREWLKHEADEQSTLLYGCTTGQRQSLIPTVPYPRMVRDNDTRGHQHGQSEYLSAIGRFLVQFGQFCTGTETEFSPTLNDPDEHLLVMYKDLRDRTERFVYLGQDTPSDQDDEFDPPLLSHNEFGTRGCRNLFVKLNDVGTQPDVDRVTSHIASSPESAGLIRLLLLASYLIRSVVLTVVEAPDEEIAFDIFDALNTTGEPLTALETLKPHVVRFERNHGHGYSGSDSEIWWEILEENIIGHFDTPDQRQKETKELVTGFALYYQGDKLGSELSIQRNTLRNYFNRAEQLDHDVAKKIVPALSRMAQFRRQFWDKTAIDSLFGQQIDSEDYQRLKLCLRFIADANTSTAIPLLARYWIEFKEIDSGKHFIRAVQAVAAFLALRRAMTGGTARIDADFRTIMRDNLGSNGNPLCLGLSMTNRILDIDELKNAFRALLEDQFNVSDKATWLQRTREIPLGINASRVVCKFLLFASAHNARADESHPGLLKREGIISSTELRFLNHTTWTGPLYTTIEHVAPESDKSSGWHPKIYDRSLTRQTLGNLVLLPERENSSIGNASWDKKRLFYRALVAKTEAEREDAIKLAEQQGLEFGSKTRVLINNQERLHMLDPIAYVEDWSVELIEARTENLLSLAWDQIAPWLFD